jgi:peroxiredoxin Q/BCP
MSLLKERDPAPGFQLLDDQGKTVALEHFRGKSIVFYFYPKDMTPGCTQEACDFRDRWLPVQQKGAIVLGVSADTVEKHEAFKNNTRFPSPFFRTNPRRF